MQARVNFPLHHHFSLAKFAFKVRKRRGFRSDYKIDTLIYCSGSLWEREISAKKMGGFAATQPELNIA